MSGIPTGRVKRRGVGAGVEWRGVTAGAVLPVAETGTIDWDSLERHLEGLATAPLAGVVVNADTGEGAHLLPEEREAVLKFSARLFGGRLPVLSGLVAGSAREIGGDSPRPGASCRRPEAGAALLSGADGFLLESLRMGADGAMLAVAAIDPHLYVELFRARRPRPRTISSARGRPRAGGEVLRRAHP